MSLLTGGGAISFDSQLWRPSTGCRQHISGLESIQILGTPDPGLCVLVTDIDISYYGGTAGDEIVIELPHYPAVWLDWRPETTNRQTYHWSGFRVLAPGEFANATGQGGEFDVICDVWVGPYSAAVG